MRQNSFLSFIILVGFVSYAAATTIPGPSIGQMAQSVLVPVDIMTQLLYKIFYILGAVLVVGSGIQYKAHRDNPQQVPINRPIFLLIIGLVLLAVPFVAQLSSAASASNS
jgi:intracellular multiplication protein IcmD